jgi:hypothetical protein
VSWVFLALAVVVVVWVVVLCVARSRRLDRLHQRTDAARVGLESALARRSSVAVAVAETLGAARAAPGSPVAALGLAARAAGAGMVRDLPREWDQGVEARELVENALSRALAAIDRELLPTPLFADLVDAEQLVVLARRVHNDAVRDTRGLRSRRLVRWLRLYGTAPLPEYFEIADPVPGTGRVASTDGPVSRES